MPRSIRALLLFALLAVPTSAVAEASDHTHDDLVDLFFAWREFHAPRMNRRRAGLLPCSHGATAPGARGLALAAGGDRRRRLARVGADRLVPGLGRDERTRLRPQGPSVPGSAIRPSTSWFYVWPTDVPEREGPNIHGAIELPNYARPLSADDAAELTERLRVAPAVFEQAPGQPDR